MAVTPLSYTTVMPPDRRSSERIFDINLLDVEALESPGGPHTALRAIEEVCHRGHPEIEEMVSVLISRSHLLEYIISGTFRALVGSCPLLVPIIWLPSA